MDLLDGEPEAPRGKARLEASRDARAAALFLDLMFRWLPFAVLGGGGFVLQNATMVHLAPLSLALSLALFTLVDLIGLTWRGQTLGKRIIGIYIARPNGVHASFLRVVLMRWFLSSVIAGLPYFGLLWIFLDHLMALGPERRAVHDRIADTAVFVR